MEYIDIIWAHCPFNIDYNSQKFQWFFWNLSRKNESSLFPKSQISLWIYSRVVSRPLHCGGIKSGWTASSCCLRGRDTSGGHKSLLGDTCSPTATPIFTVLESKITTFYYLVFVCFCFTVKFTFKIDPKKKKNHHYEACSSFFKSNSAFLAVLWRCFPFAFMPLCVCLCRAEIEPGFLSMPVVEACVHLLAPP